MDQTGPKKHRLHGPGRNRIFRAPHDKGHPYVKVAQAVAQDSCLTFEARGVALYLLSKPSDWRIQMSDLQREGKTGKDRVLRILQELESFGYLIWSAERRRVQQPGGRFAWGDAVLYEAGNAPCSENPNMEKPEWKKPDTGKPEDGKPEAEKPASGKPETYKGLTFQRTEGQNTTDAFCSENHLKEIEITDTHIEPDLADIRNNGTPVCAPTSIDFINMDQEEEEQEENPWDSEPWSYDQVKQHVDYRIKQGDNIYNPTGLVKTILKDRDRDDYWEIEDSLVMIEAEREYAEARRVREEAQRLEQERQAEERRQQEEARQAEYRRLQAEAQETKRQRELAEAPAREAARLENEARELNAKRKGEGILAKNAERIAQRKAATAA